MEEEEQSLCLPSNSEKTHNSESVSCQCGCVPKGMMSLFQMAELRKKFREAQKKSEQKQSQSNPQTTSDERIERER